MNRNYDAIVIGSGLSGLTSALTMARKGKKVLVLEQHCIPGGYATTFKRKDFKFEVSLHKTPGLKKGCDLYKALDDLNIMKRIKPIKLKPTKISFSKGEVETGEGFFEKLKMSFPEEKRGLEQIEVMMNSVMREIRRMTMLSILPKAISTFIGFWLTPTLYHLRSDTLLDVFESYIQDKELREVIASRWMFFGLPIDKISAIFYLTGLYGFINEETFYIEGGSQSLSNALYDEIEAYDGQILFNHRVTGLNNEGRRITGVTAYDLKRKERIGFKASTVVANTHPSAIKDMLNDKLHAVYDQYINKAGDLESSTSATVVFIGLDCKLSDIIDKDLIDTIKIDQSTSSKEIFTLQEKGLGGRPLSISDYPSLAPKGKSVISVIRNDFIHDLESMTKEQYKDYKNQIKSDVIYQLNNLKEGFSEHIEHIEISTPLTMKRYTNNQDGGFNGYAYTPNRVGMGNGGIPIKTPFKGLYMLSAWSGAFSGGYTGTILVSYAFSNMFVRGGKNG